MPSFPLAEYLGHRPLPSRDQPRQYHSHCTGCMRAPSQGVSWQEYLWTGQQFYDYHNCHGTRWKGMYDNHAEQPVWVRMAACRCSPSIRCPGQLHLPGQASCVHAIVVRNARIWSSFPCLPFVSTRLAHAFEVFHNPVLTNTRIEPLATIADVEEFSDFGVCDK